MYIVQSIYISHSNSLNSHEVLP